MLNEEPLYLLWPKSFYNIFYEGMVSLATIDPKES